MAYASSHRHWYHFHGLPRGGLYHQVAHDPLSDRGPGLRGCGTCHGHGHALVRDRGRGLDHVDHSPCLVDHLYVVSNHHAHGGEMENDLYEEECGLDGAHGQSQSAKMQMGEYEPTTDRLDWFAKTMSLNLPRFSANHRGRCAYYASHDRHRLRRDDFRIQRMQTCSDF